MQEESKLLNSKLLTFLFMNSELVFGFLKTT